MESPELSERPAQHEHEEVEVEIETTGVSWPAVAAIVVVGATSLALAELTAHWWVFPSLATAVVLVWLARRRPGAPGVEPRAHHGASRPVPPASSVPAAPRGPAGGPPRPLAEPLSERELEVLALLASGRSNSEIASALTVALGTVKCHVNTIYRKLEATNRAAATARAFELGLVARQAGEPTPGPR